MWSYGLPRWLHLTQNQCYCLNRRRKATWGTDVKGDGDLNRQNGFPPAKSQFWHPSQETSWSINLSIQYWFFFLYWIAFVHPFKLYSTYTIVHSRVSEPVQGLKLEGEGTSASQCCLTFKYLSGLTLKFRVAWPGFCAAAARRCQKKTQKTEKCALAHQSCPGSFAGPPSR